MAVMDIGRYQEYNGPALPRAYGQALAFRTMAELIRRHLDRDLRLAVLQPGGGQYYCISLVEGRFEQARVMWNLNGTSLEIRGDSPSSRASLRWPTLLGSEVSAAALIESVLGWPRAEAGESTAAVTVAVLAELVARYALSSTRLDLVCGWLDTSGGSGGVEAWAAQLPQVRNKLACAGDDWKLQACIAARYWAILGSQSHLPIFIVDVSTGDVLDAAGKVRWSIASEFRSGAGIREMAWKLETLWRSGAEQWER